MEIPGYYAAKKIYQGKKFIVARGTRTKDNISCIFKILEKKAAYDIKILQALKKEYRFLQAIHSEFVVQAIDWFEDKETAAIIIEDIQGENLKEILKQKRKLSPGEFLRIAIQITGGLAAIHKENIIHKDINPTNIILAPETNQAKIIDFDIASQNDIKISPSANPGKLEGTLLYISPEQTGRVNHVVDLRSDMYSLGVTFYEMLTGHPPFEYQSPTEVVYSHLAREPQPPHLFDEQIPSILSKIILKLMAKDPAERYQSAEGLKNDLEKTQQLNFTDFPLAEKDFTGKLQIPGKLYGREKQIQQLVSAYQEVRKGNKEIILVGGYAGTGKTVLVNQIQQPITMDNGYFISGKFDLLQRTVPYFAFIQALNTFCQLLLTEPQEALLQWKSRILEAIGSLGKLLTDIIPLLESVIGKQPEVPKVGSDEARERFNYVFQQFLQSVSSPGHPVVLFIDDLQWADPDSLSFLKILFKEPKAQHLLFIGAYRDNEVSPNHPLLMTIEEIREKREDINIRNIPVKNLSRQDVQNWLTDTLKISNRKETGNLETLTDLIYHKTQGNAFFTVQFLESLYREKLLQFDFDSSRWIWDVQEIKKTNFSDNVVDLLVKKIKALPPEGQEILKLAACIGNTFNLHTLSVISEKNKDKNEKTLSLALSEHLLIPLERENYKFIHDRVHQAAYSLISAKDKNLHHLTIGRLLLANTKSMQTTSYVSWKQHDIFEVVNHLNIGIDLIENQAEKIELAHLNLEAARKARKSAAYKHSVDYIEKAIHLLPADTWQEHYKLTHSVYEEAIQSLYLYGNYAGMEELVSQLLTTVSNIDDKILAYDHRMMSYVAQNLPHLAEKTLLDYFASLGIHIPSKPGKIRTMLTLISAHLKYTMKGEHNVINLPLSQDAQARIIFRLFANGGATAIVHASMYLFPLIIGKLLGLMLKHGLVPETPFVLSVYGIMRNYMGDTSGSYRLGKLSLDLLEKIPNTAFIKPKVVTSACFYAVGWQESFSGVAERLLDNYKNALNLGDIEWAAYSISVYAQYLTRTGEVLSGVSERLQDAIDTSLRLKQHLPSLLPSFELAYVSNLLQKKSDPVFLDIDIDKILENQQEGTATVLRIEYNTRKIFLSILFEAYDQVTTYIQEVQIHYKLWQAPLIFLKSDYHFHLPLLYMQLCTHPDYKKNKKKYLKESKKFLRVMKKWAAFGPLNFLHKYHLLLAEWYRVLGKHDKAEKHYEKAIEKAYSNNFVNEAALANELAARHYLRQGREKLTSLHMTEAREGYKQWGAIAKIKHLEENYPKYLNFGASYQVSHGGSISSLSTETSGDFLDFKSILDASQALSSEVQLKRLLEKMIQILIENAGAQKGIFIENREGHLLVQAEGSTDGIEGIMQEVPVEETNKVPLSLINYVVRSKEQQVFDNISSSANYSNDPYIQDKQPKSAVCLPVLRKEKLAAIIYLENNRVEGAFTPARMDILNTLSSQIAISIENAVLYENLEQKVQERTKELQEKNDLILGGIRYSKRIQNAVLPLKKILNTEFPQHFILFLPKDIVSGDFYWYTEIENHLFLAVVDCTGHGVPGALLAMMGDIFLKEIINTKKFIQPARILEELHKKVRTQLKQDEKSPGTMDGMDVCLCRFEKGKKKLSFAGARRPLYIARKNDLSLGEKSNNENSPIQLIEIRGDRKTIGGRQKESKRTYASSEIQLSPGDIIYLSSDGFIGQPDPQIRKYGSTKFRALLKQVASLEIDEQKQELRNAYENHRAGEKQQDDITIIGIRI